jgi:hypothetical protein
LSSISFSITFNFLSVLNQAASLCHPHQKLAQKSHTLYSFDLKLALTSFHNSCIKNAISAHSIFISLFIIPEVSSSQVQVFSKSFFVILAQTILPSSLF